MRDPSQTPVAASQHKTKRASPFNRIFLNFLAAQLKKTNSAKFRDLDPAEGHHEKKCSSTTSINATRPATKRASPIAVFLSRKKKKLHEPTAKPKNCPQPQ